MRKDVHWEKADGPVSARVGGSVISLNEVHVEKANCPILVRAGGNAISLEDVHLAKVPGRLSSPGEAGRQRDRVKDVHPQKASRRITVRLGGSVISRKVVPRKANASMLARLYGSVILRKDVHWKKALCSITARLGGSVISLNDVRLKKGKEAPLSNHGEVLEVQRQSDLAQGLAAVEGVASNLGEDGRQLAPGAWPAPSPTAEGAPRVTEVVPTTTGTANVARALGEVPWHPGQVSLVGAERPDQLLERCRRYGQPRSLAEPSDLD